MNESVDFKAAYRRFRRWQLDPFEYGLRSQATHHCNNCGNDFVGNFCPICSQKENVGRITWKSVAQSIGEVWGLHNRSLVYSVVQLFLRPGYFIGDYISGKKQVSFPPVKMLALVALLGLLVDYVMGAPITGVFNNDFDFQGDKMLYIDNAFEWMNLHPDVMSLILLSYLIIPNYFIFRFAPRNTRHTLPQGFFIQVFSTAVFMILNMFYDITSLGWLVMIIAVAMVFMTYKQLFGYGIWGTIWRVVLSFVCAFTLLSIFLNINYGFHLLHEDRIADANGLFIYIPAAILGFTFLLALSYFISKPRPVKKPHAKAQSH